MISFWSFSEEISKFLELRNILGASHDQADPRDGKKLTFQAIPLEFFVIDIVSISLGKPETGFGIS
jgi:hypothetical protein